MFGIGLPEMLLIMALALIVIGPDKLPDLARSLAKGLMELKKTAESLKDSFAEEGNPLKEIRPELEEAAKSLKSQLLDTPFNPPNQTGSLLGAGTSEQKAAEAYQELLKQTGNTALPHDDSPAGPARLDSATPEIPSEDPAATTKTPPAVT
jgi:sec-independent protein translocase protein TatB